MYLTTYDVLRGRPGVGGSRFDVHVHSAPFLLLVRIDMGHPIQHYRDPQSPCRTACLLRVNTSLRPKTRVRPELLARGQVFRAAAKVHVSVPSCDAQRSNCIQLLWCSVGWSSVHHAHRLQSLRSSFVKNRTRSGVVDVLLLLTSVAVIGIVNLLADPTTWEKRLVAVAHRSVDVPVPGQHGVGGTEDLRSTCCVTGCWIGLQRHLHMLHLH